MTEVVKMPPRKRSSASLVAGKSHARRKSEALKLIGSAGADFFQQHLESEESPPSPPSPLLSEKHSWSESSLNLRLGMDSRRPRSLSRHTSSSKEAGFIRDTIKNKLHDRISRIRRAHSINSVDNSALERSRISAVFAHRILEELNENQGQATILWVVALEKTTPKTRGACSLASIIDVLTELAISKTYGGDIEGTRQLLSWFNYLYSHRCYVDVMGLHPECKSSITRCMLVLEKWASKQNGDSTHGVLNDCVVLHHTLSAVEQSSPTPSSNSTTSFNSINASLSKLRRERRSCSVMSDGGPEGMELLSQQVQRQQGTDPEPVGQHNSLSSSKLSKSFVFTVEDIQLTTKRKNVVDATGRDALLRSSSSAWALPAPLRMSLWKNHHDAMELAQQFTLVHHTMVLSIPPWEFSSYCGGKNSLHHQRHIKMCIKEFNRTCMAFKMSVLLETTIQNRGRALKGLLELAKCAMSIKNYHLVKEIHASLKSPAIYRLKQSWSRLDTPRMDIWNEMDALCSCSSNRNFQKVQEKASILGQTSCSNQSGNKQYPSVPFLSPLLGAIERTKSHSKMQNIPQNNNQQDQQQEEGSKNNIDAPPAKAPEQNSKTMDAHLSTMIQKTYEILSPFVFLSSTPPSYEFQVHHGIQSVLESYLGSGVGMYLDDPHGILLRLFRLHSRQCEETARPRSRSVGVERKNSYGSNSSCDTTTKVSFTLSTATIVEILNKLGEQSKFTPTQAGIQVIKLYVENIMALNAQGKDLASLAEINLQVSNYHTQINELMMCGESLATSDIIQTMFETCTSITQHLVETNECLFDSFLPTRLRKNKPKGRPISYSGTRSMSMSSDGSADMFAASPRSSPRNSSCDWGRLLNEEIDVATHIHAVILQQLSPFLKLRFTQCLVSECNIACAMASCSNGTRNEDMMQSTLGWSPLEFVVPTQHQELDTTRHLRRTLLRTLKGSRTLLRIYEQNLGIGT